MRALCSALLSAQPKTSSSAVHKSVCKAAFNVIAIRGLDAFDDDSGRQVDGGDAGAGETVEGNGVGFLIPAGVNNISVCHDGFPEYDGLTE